MKDWISVKEQMPPSGKIVLLQYKNCVDKNRIVIGTYVEKFTDENYDSDGEWWEYNEANDTYYLPEGGYENMQNNPDYATLYMN